MSLEDLFHGREYRFRITRFHLSGMKENVMIDVHVPAGSQHGTVISCLNVGHQRRDGTFQDILFVVEEAPHDTYARIGQDLVIKVQIPWTGVLKRKDGRIHFNGIDNRMLCARISYARDRRLVGQYRISQAGMPITSDGRVIGRGDVIVQ
ncbi:hypothetical protein BDZ89DRAFT_790892 [Hymenopellis radicata]|nr:hypothetical protein BDZ89DRAFT_790892 [Hymenopellis radicata]